MAVTPVFPVRPQKRRLDDLEEKEEEEERKKVKKEENGSLQKIFAKNLVKEDHDQQEESKEVETLMVVAAKPQELRTSPDSVSPNHLVTTAARGANSPVSTSKSPQSQLLINGGGTVPTLSPQTSKMTPKTAIKQVCNFSRNKNLSSYHRKQTEMNAIKFSQR